MIKILQSGWVIAIIGAVLYLGVTAVLLKPPRVSHQTNSDGHAVVHNVPKPSWEFVNPEINRLLAELKAEKQALKSREKELEELATRLAAERSEMNIVTQAVYRMQQEFDKHILRVKDEEMANLKRLSKTYAAMSSESAAGILKEMDDDEVVKILVNMKDKEMAALLESMAQLGPEDTKRVAMITERLRTVLYRDTATKK